MKLQEFVCGYFENELMIAQVCEVSSISDFDRVMSLGFRRSGDFIYRADCPHCGKCVPIRIRALDFVPSKSQRRVLRKNSDITLCVEYDKSKFLSEEKIALYKKYRLRHSNEILSDEEILLELAEMTSGYEGTLNMEYRLDEKLVGCGIVDAGKNCLSSNYFYYDTDCEISKRSLGVFSLITEVNFCIKASFDFLYLGYFIADCNKMNYKAQFCPHEFLNLSTCQWE